MLKGKNRKVRVKPKTFYNHTGMYPKGLPDRIRGYKVIDWDLVREKDTPGHDIFRPTVNLNDRKKTIKIQWPCLWCRLRRLFYH